ncbi:DNA/RNA non-specific endonuclease [Jiangella alkaliphila]|uniref:DNA/RNA non-specific endonuclease n=1 Tax=Jiangella alkaliphila TaxID=419479 RepID=A0A1H2H196_9ACTN|nr:DNA/RNA non-specific endonuclease [Jiangella alkaliphila]SDU25603.1 DNA/RNA non-specific endonuclease [Jiangella alkaliphila]
MTDRPIEHAVDGLHEVRDDAARGVAEVADHAKKAAERITRVVEGANVGSGTENPAADVADLGQAIQAALGHLGIELHSLLDGAADDLEELRRPAGSSAAAAAPAAVAAVPADTLPVVKVSTDAPERHPALSNPPPSSVIEVDETVRYTTDDRGRVIRTQAVLIETTPDQPRHKYAQTSLQDKLPGDHAGHIIARIFGGIGQRLNLVPMEGKLVNQGQYATLEGQWQEAVEAEKQVELDVRLYYNDQTRRPYKLVVFHTIDGKTEKTTIRNKPARKRSS